MSLAPGTIPPLELIPDVDPDTGRITVDGREITQAEAIALAFALTQAVRDSVDRHQKQHPSYYDSEAILRRQDSPLGRALTALSKVF